MSALRVRWEEQSNRSAAAAKRRRPELKAIPGGKTEGRFSIMRAPLNARSSVPFALLCAAALGAVLVSVLLLNTRMAHTSYELARLQSDLSHTVQDVQMLHEQLRAAQAALPARASELGMVPADEQVALDVSLAAQQVHRQLAATDANSGIEIGASRQGDG
jgi:hypothetical protein